MVIGELMSEANYLVFVQEFLHTLSLLVNLMVSTLGMFEKAIP